MSRRSFDRYMVQVGMGSHPKFARLTDSEFRAHIVGVLSVAALAPIRGCLLVGELEAEPADIARAAGVTVRVAISAVVKLQALGVLYRDVELGCLRVHDWSDINPEPRVDATNAERQRRLRARRSNGDVTRDSNGSNAPHNGDVTAPTARMRASASTSSSVVDVERQEVTETQREADKHPHAAFLSRLLADLIRQRDPKARVTPDADGWVREMRLLIADRGGDVVEVERIVRWSQADSFWQGVILSPRKLREKFTQLLLKSQRPASGNGRRENASDMLRALDGAA